MVNYLNISIVLFNSEFTQIYNLVKVLRANSKVNQVYLIDNSPIKSNLFETLDSYYIFAGKNLGYGAGHNIAIQKTIDEGVKYHLVLNPDIYFESDVLTHLIDYADRNEDIGLIMPNVEYPDGQPQHLCKLMASPFDLLGRRFIPFKKWIISRNILYELRFTDYNQIMSVPSLSGCFMLLRTSVLSKIGGFDERFFMYCEDNDLSRRIGQVSKTIFYPHITVTHDYEKGSYKDPKLLRYHITSAFKYFNKWGWFFDKERKRINKETLLQLGYKKDPVAVLKTQTVKQKDLK